MDYLHILFAKHGPGKYRASGGGKWNIVEIESMDGTSGTGVVVESNWEHVKVGHRSYNDWGGFDVWEWVGEELQETCDCGNCHEGKEIAI